MSKTDHELKAYDQLCESYRAIDDFRAKLLGLLPLATGAGIGVLLEKFPHFQDLEAEMRGALAAAGVFGALITLGLFSYEIYGIKRCGALIMAGRRIEVLADIENGQFKNRPRSVGHLINEPFAAGIVYPSVLAAWTYLILTLTWPSGRFWMSLLVLTGGLVGTLIYDYILRSEAEQEINVAERRAHSTAV